MGLSFKDYQEKMKNYKNKIIKDISVNVYIQNLKKIFKEHFECDEPNPLFFKDYKPVLNYIDSLPTNASRKTMCTSILVMLRHCPNSEKIRKIYVDKLFQIAENQNKIYIENQKSNKEQKNWITMEEINDKINELEKLIEKSNTPRQKLVLTQKYLLLNLYTKIPPLRNDYAFTKIYNTVNDVPDNENENYIVLSKKQMILQVYKTSKFYGSKTISLPDDVVNLIRNFEKLKKNLNKNINHNYMLIKTDFTPMNKLNLTKTLNKIFKPKKVSTTILRKVYLSYKYPIQHSISEMQQDAEIMGHDFMTARKIYTKINN